jgi:hypothetical protein
MPALDTYRGLSGIDSALFTLLATRVLHESIALKDRPQAILAGVILALFVAKTAYEWTTGATLFVDSAAANMLPIPLAHVMGGLVGVSCNQSRRGFRQPTRQFRGC